MVSVTAVRNKLASKVFNKLGSLLSIEAYSSQTTDKWGDSTVAYSAATSVKAVPYNYTKKQLAWEPFGDLQDGEVAVVVPYDTTVTARDRVTYDSRTWYVKRIESFNMGDGTTDYVLAYALLLAEPIH